MHEIVTSFLKIGATAYGGPAIMGMMQAEFQERRQWVSKPQFLEGLSLVNMLPGATATQLGIFLGYRRGGWWGGLLAGLAFVIPGFAVMLALTLAYAALGVTPLLRGALYGLGPVVLAVFTVAIYRLGNNALKSRTQVAIAVVAAAAALFTPLGVASVLLLCGGVGLALFYDRRVGAVVLLALAAVIAVLRWAPLPAMLAPGIAGTEPTLGAIAARFAVIGAVTFGGGISMIALLQDQVVHQLQWLTPQEFVDGLALGQLTPGPVLILAAYVGYKALGLTGALVGALASFLPSFVLMLAILPVFDRVRAITWARAALQGVMPGVIGALAVSLVRIAPPAMPDVFAAFMYVVGVVVLLVWSVAPLKLVAAGAVVGILRRRLGAAWGM